MTLSRKSLQGHCTQLLS